MDYKWCRTGRKVHDALQREDWDEALMFIEEFPLSIWWNQLSFNYPEQMFSYIWERNREAGRECVRILLRDPSLAKAVELRSALKFGAKEYAVQGRITGILAAFGEKELLNQALDCGLNVDGWETVGWYEKDGDMYDLNNSLCGCRIMRLLPRFTTSTTTIFHKSLTEQYGNDIYFTTPLLIALLQGDSQTAELLIQQGAAFDPDNWLCKFYLGQCNSQQLKKLVETQYGRR